MKARLLAVAVVILAATCMSAKADIIYQSIPNLTATIYTSSQSDCCVGFENEGIVSQFIGQEFSLQSAARARSITFAVDIYNGTPSSVTLGIYKDQAGTVGTNLYNHTFPQSQFLDIRPQTNGPLNPTELITVNLSHGVRFTAGNYLLFMFNRNYLGIPGYTGPGSGHQVAVFAQSSQTPLQDGDRYFDNGPYNSAVSISTDRVTPRPTAVPGPTIGAGLPGLIVASAVLLAWWRRKRRAQVVG